MKMDYEKMWNELKEHYQKRITKLDNRNYDSSINPRTMAKSVFHVMEHFELKNKKEIRLIKCPACGTRGYGTLACSCPVAAEFVQ